MKYFLVVFSEGFSDASHLIADETRNAEQIKNFFKGLGADDASVTELPLMEIFNGAVEEKR